MAEQNIKVWVYKWLNGLSKDRSTVGRMSEQTDRWINGRTKQKEGRIWSLMFLCNHLFKSLAGQVSFSHFQAVLLFGLVSHLTVRPPVMKGHCSQVVECRIKVMSHVFYKKKSKSFPTRFRRKKKFEKITRESFLLNNHTQKGFFLIIKSTHHLVKYYKQQN